MQIVRRLAELLGSHVLGHIKSALIMRPGLTSSALRGMLQAEAFVEY